MKSGFIAVLLRRFGSGTSRRSGSNGRHQTFLAPADGKPNMAAPAPRTPDGKPDLSGLWAKISPKYARNIVSISSPEDLRPSTRRVVEARREDLGKDGMQVRCPAARPGLPHVRATAPVPEMMRVIQTPQLIVMLNPDLTYRQIWMDGRSLEANPNPFVDGLFRGTLGR
jgi:hypothetical protein